MLLRLINCRFINIINPIQSADGSKTVTIPC